jgi:3-polyprenyl-4-hydroxybenzoate decarboxylase
VPTQKLIENAAVLNPQLASWYFRPMTASEFFRAAAERALPLFALR